MNKRFLEWKDIEIATERLAVNIKASGKKIIAVNGLARGGLIPAVILSHKLRIPFMSENNTEEGYILIVDDICDTGETLKQYSEHEYILTATLHYKTSAIIEPNFWWKLADNNTWYYYPWEEKNSQTIPDYATKRK